VKKYFEQQLNIFLEKKKEEEDERIASEKAKKKREEEKRKVEEPKGARVEEITEEEAKRIQEKNKEPEPQQEKPKAEDKPMAEDSAPAKSDDDNGPAPIGNGGKTDKYVWTQTLSEVVINIPVPNDTRGKMVSVTFGQKKIKVEVKGQPPIIDGEFPERIKVLFK
jgi:cytoskeletal protein RodZ